MNHVKVRSGHHMVTKPSATGGEPRSQDTPKAQSHGRGPRYRVRTRGEPPADLRDRISWVHAQAISHLGN